MNILLSNQLRMRKIIVTLLCLMSSLLFQSNDHGVVRFGYSDIYNNDKYKGTIKAIAYFDFYNDLSSLIISTQTVRVFYLISQYAIFDETTRISLKLIKDLNEKNQTLIYVTELPLELDTISLKTNKSLEFIEIVNFKTKNKLIFYNK